MATSVKDQYPWLKVEDYWTQHRREHSCRNTQIFHLVKLRLIIFRHFSAKYDFVAEKKRLVVFLTASGELLGSPSVSKPLEISWTYPLSSPENTTFRSATHFVAEKKKKNLLRRRKEKISLYCMQASDAVGLYPHKSPNNWGSTLSCIWCNACTEIDISQVSEWPRRYSIT